MSIYHCSSLKYGSIVAGMMSTITCVMWLYYKLYNYYHLEGRGINLIIPGVMLVISAIEVFGVCIENEWLILPWLIVYAMLLIVMPFILFVYMFYNLYVIFAVVLYFIYMYLWSIVQLYYMELFHLNEQNVSNRRIRKFCEPWYTFNTLYLFEVLYKAWCSKRSRREVQDDITQENHQETAQETRL